MKVRVNLLRQNKVVEVDLPENAKVRDLVKKLGFSTQGVVVMRDFTPLVEDEPVTPGEYSVLQVASGG